MPELADFTHGGVHVAGFSLAGEETFIICPELNLGFDLGRAPREVVSIDHIFLSHGHMDHAAGVAYYFSQRMFVDNQPGHLYAPELLLGPIRRLLRTWGDIDGHEPPAHLHAAAPGVDVPLRRDLLVRPFEVNHSCRLSDGTRLKSLGFTAIEVRQKLKDEFRDMTGPRLVELKSRGVEITRRLELPLVTYCGDTAPGPFLQLDFVRNSRILLLECTFVEADHRDRARAGSHMHVDDLREVYPQLNNERIVLTHLSRRTPLSEARRVIRRVLGDEAMERLCFLMQFKRRSGRRPPSEPDAEGTKSET